VITAIIDLYVFRSMSKPPNLTERIQRAQEGDGAAADALFAATYEDLRKLARARLRDGSRPAAMHPDRADALVGVGRPTWAWRNRRARSRFSKRLTRSGAPSMPRTGSRPTRRSGWAAAMPGSVATPRRRQRCPALLVFSPALRFPPT
jgi:hypothetical protein